MEQTILKNAHPSIVFRDCPTGCVIFQERKMGPHGPFFVCHRCHNTISEHQKGGPAEPCDVCNICKGLMFWRTLPDGTRFKACWSPHLHHR